ncbi:BrnT family toxin [Leptospira kirschneri]|uniref:BrnT family toxin n=1 Tax=Leptospira kirschneri TaxID=29507 RepID=UPI0004A4CF3F|nr:BrnT family toxin [Leptospira kirschneri]
MILWDEAKNDKLKRDRKISFEAIEQMILDGDVIDIIETPSGNHPGQESFVLKIKDQYYYVPFKIIEQDIILITIIPTRKLRRRYEK